MITLQLRIIYFFKYYLVNMQCRKNPFKFYYTLKILWRVQNINMATLNYFQKNI